MSFVLHALLTDASPVMSPEIIRSMLDDKFSRGKSYSSNFEEIPFIRAKAVRAKWGTWSAVCTYGEGQDVRNDCEEISRRLGEAAPIGLANIDRRVHVSFAVDPDRLHTDHMVDLMQFLEEIEGVIVFDPTQNKILNPRADK